MGLRHKLLISLFIIFCPNISILFYGIHYLNTLEQRLHRINNHLMPSLHILQQFRHELQVAYQTLNLQFYENLSTDGFPQPWSLHIKEIRSHLLAVSASNPTARTMIDRIATLEHHIESRETRKLLEEVPLIARWFEREVTTESLQTQKELHSSLNQLVLTLSASLVLSLISFLFIHSHLKRLSLLFQATQQVAKGKYQLVFPTEKFLHQRSHDEIDQLAREFNSMVMQLEKRQKALLASERLAAIGRHSAQVAHEIRNPLNAMNLNLEMLKEELGPSQTENVNLTLKTLQNEIQRLERLTASYLETRPEHMQDLLPGAGQLVSISDAIQQADTLFRETLAQREIQVRVYGKELGREVMRPSDQIIPVIINLIRNAIDAIQEKGAIEINLKKNPHSIVMIVEDTGPGIPRDQREAVLEPFFSTKPKGTGLGLTIVQNYLKRMGGSLKIQDPTRLKGARIECDLGQPQNQLT